MSDLRLRLDPDGPSVIFDHPKSSVRPSAPSFQFSDAEVFIGPMPGGEVYSASVGSGGLYGTASVSRRSRRSGGRGGRHLDCVFSGESYRYVWSAKSGWSLLWAAGKRCAGL